MTREEAHNRLVALNHAIKTAVQLIGIEREILDRFFAEARDFDTLGPILDPTLWMNLERRQVEAMLKPVYSATRDLLNAYDRAREEALQLGVRDL
jgi:hypothetical protein